MTPRETVILVRYVKALCPQQAIDEFTPDAWHDVLGDYDLADARAACVAVASRQPFVAPAEIIAEVRRARNRTLEVERSEAIIAPVRRRQLRDPRPVREQIDAIFEQYGRRELLRPTPAPAAHADKPRYQQLAELDALIASTDETS